ncbi:hypothetical protein [Carboxylicivirga linearis]|uniref:Uncharacterized protein n=1 Tax=Carboxylicivirga linearis TaxID=1628157 RepID=A0ABS5JWJ2_9BACT|nr:hypothetical protein [Carboxylicivirga linearis]MBS2099193.1 hypothetical protein [Carboxylicivirga linearis]
MEGVLLDKDYELMIRPKLDSSGKILSGLVVGDSTDQCAALVLEMSQGELKEDPLLGPGLTKFIRSKYTPSQIDQRIRSHFTRAGINYEEYKDRINKTIKTVE